MESYKILTPSFRAEIDKGFNDSIAELQSCEQNSLVRMQIEGLKMWKRYIDGLPDGVPLPVKRRGEE